MPGVKGAGGPVPKRSSQRRRTNSPETETVVVASAEVVQPEPDEKWHPAAAQWYRALAESGQATFYEPSDWATAWLIAESISRDLKPQVVGVNDETGEPVFAVIPMKGANLSAYLKAMTALLVTEGDRRRARLELERSQPDVQDDKPAGVTALDEYRSRLSG